MLIRRTEDNAGTMGAPSGPTVSFNQSTATVNDNHAPMSTASGSGTITSAPMTTSAASTATSSSTAAATTSSKSMASNAGSYSLGEVFVASLAFMFAVAI
jgi:hypothetical protein